MIGDIAERVVGRVVLFGKRIGEVNGLVLVNNRSSREEHPRTDS